MFNFTPPKLTAGNALKGVAIATLLTVAGAAGASTSHAGHNHDTTSKTVAAKVTLVAAADHDRSSNRRERRRDDRRTDRRRDRDDDRRTDRRRDRDSDTRRDRRREYRPTYRRGTSNYGYGTRSSRFGYRTSPYYGYRTSRSNRGYQTNYRSGLGINFSFGTPGYSNYRWASNPYSGYRSSYGSFGQYQSRTYCQRVTVEGWHHGHRELVSVKQCSNPWDGTYIVQGSERIIACRG